MLAPRLRSIEREQVESGGRPDMRNTSQISVSTISMQLHFPCIDDPVTARWVIEINTRHNLSRTRNGNSAALRWLILLLTCGVLLFETPVWSSDLTDIERAEQVGWTDPEAAIIMLDVARQHLLEPSARVRGLVVQGVLYADTRRDTEALAAIDQLESLNRSGVRGARAGSHLLRAYLLCHSDHYKEARSELRLLNDDDADSGLDRFRLQILRGTVLHFVGEQEAALTAYERALDLARSVASTSRETRALVKIAQLHILTGRLDKAGQLLVEAQSLSAANHDEAALTEILLRQSDVAARRGDQTAERNASLQALAHARASGSRQMIALGLSNLADSYLRTKDYPQSLHYSQEALPIARTLHRNALEQTILFNIGVVKINTGSLGPGEEMIESVIAAAIQNGDEADAAELLHEYGQTLEQARQWQTALGVYHRENTVRERLLDAMRQRSLLEVEARFDADRKTRQIGILERDNALQRANFAAQQFRQKVILCAAILAIAICIILTWAFNRLSKAGALLRYASEHDTLTGLHNRRYFNDKILLPQRNRGFEGCLILIDVDHFKRINDALGHPIGDAVLTALGERLSHALREQDTLVRWGGEEFLAVLQPLSEPELNATVGRLLTVVEMSPVHVNGQIVECTVSIGCARFPLQGAAIDIALERAINLVDKALYRAKRSGRNRACFVRALRAPTEQEAWSVNLSFEAATSGELLELLEAR